MNPAVRFAQTIGYYFLHELARTPPPIAPQQEETQPDISNSRKANSTRAVQKRKARYGKSKLKRKTREGMKDAGNEVNTDGE